MHLSTDKLMQHILNTTGELHTNYFQDNFEKDISLSLSKNCEGEIKQNLKVLKEIYFIVSGNIEKARL